MLRAGLALIGVTDKKLLGTLLIAVGGLMKITKQDPEGHKKDGHPEKEMNKSHRAEPTKAMVPTRSIWDT